MSARIRLCHTRVAHSYLLLGEEQPQCVGCDAPFTIHYFLLECDDFSQIIHKYYQVHNMKQLFQDISVDNSMMFLKEINIFNKIYEGHLESS